MGDTCNNRLLKNRQSRLSIDKIGRDKAQSSAKKKCMLPINIYLTRAKYRVVVVNTGLKEFTVVIKVRKMVNNKSNE